MSCLTKFREAHITLPLPFWSLYLHVCAELHAPYLGKDAAKDGEIGKLCRQDQDQAPVGIKKRV